jgi:glycerophosphoryl diester phosphodiesterase
MNMKIIGHRGARGLAPENTIAGLRKGVEHHVDMLEFDVRVTKDGVPVLHHDKELVDPNGQKHSIAKSTYRQLKNHKKDLATLDEALATVGRDIPLYIEVKPGEPISSIVKVIRAHLAQSLEPKGLRLASFNQETLLQLDKALPEVPKIVIEAWSGIRAGRRARQLGTRHIVMNQRWLWRGFIALMTRRGYELGAYTINKPSQAATWRRYGLRSVVTDYPDRFETL